MGFGSAPDGSPLQTQWCLLIAMSNPQYDHYRLVLVPASTRRIFVEDSQRSTDLPRIRIPRWTRAAEQVQTAIEERWRLKAVVIDFLGNGPGRDGIVVAELRGGNRMPPLPHSHSWARLSDIPEDAIAGSQRSTIEKLLNLGATGCGRFSRFGWIEEALDWVSAAADMDRAQFTGDIKQLNASADFALVRFGRKAAPPIWFKAVGDPSIAEYRITTTLAKLFPRFLPVLVASREDWNAWWMEDAGRSFDDARSADFFGQAVARLAELQKASIRYIPALLECGCADQRTSILRARIPEMMEYIDEAMAQLNLSQIPRLGSSRIRELGSILEEACFNLEALRIPDTLLHGDLGFGNLLMGLRGCVFTDWAQASIGNPFVTFEHLRGQIAQEANTAPWVPRLSEIYQESWRKVLTDAQIKCALALVPPIAVSQYLLGRWDWLATERRHDPKFQSYVRGLARQMDRAVQALELGEVLCA